MQPRVHYILQVVSTKMRKKKGRIKARYQNNIKHSLTRPPDLGWRSYLYTAGWTSSSLEGGSCRTGAPGGWGACILFVPQIVAHRSGLPPGARRAQASPLFRDMESRPPAWGLPELDSSSLRIGQLSWGDPRRSGGKRLGRSFGSLSSSSFLLARTGALLVACSSAATTNKGLNRKDRGSDKIPYSSSCPCRRTNYKTPPLGWIFSVFVRVIKGCLFSFKAA